MRHRVLWGFVVYLESDGRVVARLLGSNLFQGEHLMKNSLWVVFGVLLSLALAFSGAQAVAAQEVTATGTGTVLDTSGAVGPRAVINARTIERANAYSTTATESGLYRLPQL